MKNDNTEISVLWKVHTCSAVSALAMEVFGGLLGPTQVWPGQEGRCDICVAVLTQVHGLPALPGLCMGSDTKGICNQKACISCLTLMEGILHFQGS